MSQEPDAPDHGVHVMGDPTITGTSEPAVQVRLAVLCAPFLSSTRCGRRLLVATTALVAFSVSLGACSGPPAQLGSFTHAESPSEADAASALVSQEGAIAASLQRFPDGFAADSAFAKRVKLEALIDDWYRGRAFPDWDPQWDVWVVAFLSDGLTRDDVIPPPPMEPFTGTRPPGVSPIPAVGAYYVWLADTGELLGEGVLDALDGSEEWHTYERLQSVGGDG